MDDLNEKNTDNAPARNAGEYITVLMEYFRPAGEEKDTIHWLTTSEVSDAIRRRIRDCLAAAYKPLNS
jgi:hypothetical protein